MSDLANCAYNEPFYVQLRGELNVAALQQAIKGVFNRHDAFHLQIDRSPLQVFAEDLEIQVPFTDLSEAAEEQQARHLQKLFKKLGSTPYDLERGPLARFHLVRLQSQLHVLLASAHHIVCDGWSWNHVLTELGQLYRALKLGCEHGLEEPASFADYARELAANAVDADESLAYWLEQYRELPGPLELPVDRQRLPVKSYRGSTLVYEFDSEVLRLARQAASRSKVSLFSFVFTAFNVLLARLSSHTDIVVTVPTAGQLAYGMPGLVGHCVNLLPVRTTIDFQQSFSALLQQTTSNLLTAYDHQHCTLGQIVKHLKISRNASRLPLAEVNFNLERVAEQASFDELEIEVVQTPKCAVNFDLFFNLCEYKDRLRLDLDYSTDLFEAETLLRWSQHFEVLLRNIATDLNQPVVQIPLLDELQKTKILSDRNQTAQAYERVPVTRLFEKQVEQSSRAVAVKYRKRKLTYAKLNQRVNQLAHHLKSLNVGPGTFVGLHLSRSEQMVIAALATLKTGAAFVPLDPSFPAERLQYMVADSALSHLVTETDLLERLHPASATVICLDVDAQALARLPTHNPPTNEQLESPAYMIYTSGSTGRPKGVVVPHRALSNFLQAMKQRPGMQAEDTLLGITTLSFDISILEIFLPLIVGARLVIADRDVCLDGRLLSSLMAKEKVSVMQATPATWQLLIHSGWQGRSNLKILCGGEALSIELAKELTSRGKTLWNMYGPTETTIWSSVAEVRDSDSLIDLGQPIANTTFYVLDSQLSPVPYGVAGNLYIGGEGLALGYWNQELLTREKFIRDPFSSNSRIYDTGDVVRRLANGGFEYLGRRDSQVKVRGFRIELGEIENALKQRSEVNDACVIARPVTSAESELVAYVVMDSEKDLDPVVLRSELRSSLPEYMLPAHFVFLDALPLTPNYKVDRRRLPMPSPTRSPTPSQAAGPRTENEKRIVQAFERVLGRANIGLDDNFFDLGGHSLAAARLLSEVERIHRKRLPLAMLLQAPTPRLIALELGGKEETQWNSMVPIRARGGLPPIYCIHAAGGNVLLYRDLAKHLGDDQPVYGLQSDALQSGVPKAQTVEEMASAYAQEIIANQTHGPIHLCGYCLGGSIAYEVAQQLTQLGHQVGLVALFDTHSNWLQEEKGSRRYQQIKFHLENLALSGLKGSIGFLGAKLQEANRRFSRKVASQTSRAAFQLGIRKAPPVQVLDHIYDLASEKYIAQPYEGRVVVFKPKQAYAGYEDASLGWRGLVDDLEVIELPVYPAGMLMEPFVHQLAALLRKCLNEASTETETRHSRQEISAGELLSTN